MQILMQLMLINTNSTTHYADNKTHTATNMHNIKETVQKQPSVVHSCLTQWQLQQHMQLWDDKND